MTHAICPLSDADLESITGGRVDGYYDPLPCEVGPLPWPYQPIVICPVDRIGFEIEQYAL